MNPIKWEKPKSMPEKAMHYTYIMETDRWIQTPIHVILDTKPFDKGSMREAYFMLNLSVPEEEQQCVAKRTLSRDDNSIYFLDAEMQALSKRIAQHYNNRNPPKRVDFIEASLIKLIERRNQPVMAIEKFMEGKYIKHNNNYGFVHYDERNTPQAFSHFSYYFLQGELLLCDIQGVGDLYTDPQFHSKDGNGFGMGNLGQEGMVKFFETHRCNKICRYLGLTLSNPIPEDQDRGTSPAVCEALQRLSVNQLHKSLSEIMDPQSVSSQGSNTQEAPRLSPRAAPKKIIDNPFDLKLLGLTEEVLLHIKNQFDKFAEDDRINGQGLVSLCEVLGKRISLDEAGRVLDYLESKMSHREYSLDFRQFIWWWRGVDEEDEE